ncbi:MAG: transglutaminase N-terminal domain-containing protein [Cyanobium sp.]
MRFHLQHRLRYCYERPVFLEPHTLRLTPRQDPAQRLLAMELAVSPAASGRSESLDADGNSSVVLWFDDLRQDLELSVTMEVETLRVNPFDWILSSRSLARLPLTYPAATALSLQPFLAGDQPVDASRAAGPVKPEAAGRWKRSLAGT